MFVLKQTTDQEESPMESTLSSPAPATSSTISPADAGRLAVSPGTLLEVFAQLPDPRRGQGTRFALSAILALAVCAILSNHLSVLAIAEWGASQCQELLASLGFKDGVTPHQSTLQRLFCRLDPNAPSEALTSHFARLESAKPLRGSEGVAIDGKAQRGRLAFDSSGGTVHALSAYLHDLGIVLAQEPIEPHPLAASATPDATSSEPKPNEADKTLAETKTETTEPPVDRAVADKAEAELSVAPDLLKRIDLRGRVLTGDALFCQRNLSKQVVDSGGDYLFIVKENQPRLHEDIRLLFDPPPGLSLPLEDRRLARTVDHGHGRHYDTRVLIASIDLVGYSDWPDLAQVFSLERTWREKGKTKREVRFGVTSLPREVAGAERLLELTRGHWRIENCDHYVKDVTLGEDRSLVHLGNGPSILAMLRDLALSLLHRAGYRAIASRLRYHSVHPEKSVALLLGQNA
jgi:predicted transposase YbfD/YdcC